MFMEMLVRIQPPQCFRCTQAIGPRSPHTKDMKMPNEMHVFYRIDIVGQRWKHLSPHYPSVAHRYYRKATTTATISEVTKEIIANDDRSPRIVGVNTRERFVEAA